MRYLANVTEYPWDGFWQSVVDTIKLRLAEVRILRPRHRGPLRLIGEHYLLPNMCLDEVGNPLFDDLPGLLQIYLSTGYKDEDLEILTTLGLKRLTQSKFLELVKRDLSLSSPLLSSRMKSQHSTDGWHTRAAKALNLTFTNNWVLLFAYTKALDVQPLSDGRWISSNDGPTFFPTVGNGILVPKDLGLQLLDSKACSNAERRKLFENLGAKKLNAQQEVRPRIVEKYACGNVISLEDSCAHLVFLYLTHKAGFHEYHDIKLHTHQGHCYSPNYTDFHFINEDPYSLWKLSQTQQTEHVVLEGIHFLHPRYLKEPPKQTSQHELNWEDWLQKLGVRRYTRLVDRRGSRLSEECVKVAKAFPKKFLGFLRYAWNSEGSGILRNRDALEELVNTVVLCKWNEEEARPLRRSYLPLPSLKNQCLRFMEDDEFFPFLYLEEPLLEDGDAATWNFLSEHLQAKTKDDSLFYVDMLISIALNSWRRYSESWVRRPLRVMEIYTRIHSRCCESERRHSAQLDTRQILGPNAICRCVHFF